MLRNILLSFALIYSAFAFSQTGTIKVKVKEKETKELIPGAVVVVYSGTVVVATAVTDIEGQAILKPLSPGKYKVRASYTGYQSKEISGIIVAADKTCYLNIEMAEATVKLMETCIVSSASGKASKKSMSRASYDESAYISTATSEGMAFEEGEYLKRESIASKSGAKANVEMGRAHVLTAGQLNDFGKWDIWKDVSTNELGKNNETWKIRPLERYTIQVTTTERRPVIDAQVELYVGGELQWVAHTDNTGKAELWQDIFEKKSKGNVLVKITYKRKSYELQNPKSFANGINMLQIKTECDVPKKADVMFVVDATGSMGDEIEYLKMELNDIIEKVKKKNDAEINLGSVFYRDQGDEYVTVKSDFSTNENQTINFIKRQHAGGGGDFPEAVHSALEVAINEMEWSDDAVARLLFLVLDAPPHQNEEVIASVQKNIKLAAKKGIRIIPIASSGVDKTTEYLMRAFALATNGTYVFLTDHSGVGGSHIKPSTDKYDVELLNDLLLRLFNEYIHTTPCDETPIIKTKNDTSWVFNRQIIDRVIADTTLLKKHQQARTVSDTLKLMLTDTSSTLQKDFYSFKYYPNPTAGELNIEIEGNAKEIFIADITGKIVMRHDIPATDRIQIDISSLSKGTYFVMYQQGERLYKGKVVLM